MPAKVGPELKKVNGCIDHRQPMVVPKDTPMDKAVAMALESLKYRVLKVYQEIKPNDWPKYYDNIGNDSAPYWDKFTELVYAGCDYHMEKAILAAALMFATEEDK